MMRKPETAPRPRRWQTALAWLCLAGLLAPLATATVACHPTARDGVSDSTFVRSMTGLRLVAQDTGLDSAGRGRARDSILRIYRVSPAQLESAAGRLSNDPPHAATLLHAIDAKVAAAKNPRPPVTPNTKPIAPAPPATTPARAVPAKKPAAI